MNVRLLRSLVLVIAAVLAAVACNNPTPEGPESAPPTPDPSTYSRQIDSYVAVAPRVLRSGQTQYITASLFQGKEPAQGSVYLTLSKPETGRVIAEATGFVQGSGPVPLSVPELSEGGYTLTVAGEGADGGTFFESAEVQVRAASTILFLETDKPIYKPGQQVNIRALRLDQDLKPLPGPLTVEVQDAKGIKVYKRMIDVDRFGMANATLPLSTEPNLGVWKLSADSGDRTTQLDVRVEEYVLPKYEITLDLPRDWVLANEAVVGTVSAEYSFGKPVRGEVDIIASRYVGVWEEYASFTKEIDGETSFELPAPGYVAGTPAAAGQGNLLLDVAVREPSTGYVEQTSHLMTVADSPVNLQLIPESISFKPGLPFSLLLVAETPGHDPVDTKVSILISYFDEEFELLGKDESDLETLDGKALIESESPEEAVALTVFAQTDDSEERLALEAKYSPSANFIHVEQQGNLLLKVGDQASFITHSTAEAQNFYYEVMARDRVVFSDVTQTPDLSFVVTPEMAPSGRLVVYQVLPNNEVAADYLPFDVSASYPMEVDVHFSANQAIPGEAVDIRVNTEGPAKVGLVSVDRSVFILAENRLNLQQVFADLERLYATPQVEVLPNTVSTQGAADTFREAGLVVLSDKPVPEGAEFARPRARRGFSYDWTLVLVLVFMAVMFIAFVVAVLIAVIAGIVGLVRRLTIGLFMTMMVVSGVWVGCGGGWEEGGLAVLSERQGSGASDVAQASELAEVQRVRQFFPETWLWADVMTDEAGNATLPATTPDSITTWNLRAVGMSPEHGLGVGDAELVVFQPFFLQVDLPYAAVRGEEFPVRVALYNYLDTEQEFLVELEVSRGFTLQGDYVKTVVVEPNEVGGVSFDIRLTGLGRLPIKVSARSGEAADAVIETLLVEPEGVEEETVDNAILSDGDRLEFNIGAPQGAIPGSDRTYVSLTGSYLAQTLNGLESLLRMPYGCGEQNMILFAPNIYVARYLEATGQLKPEVMAKAEHLMTTGYQRELTYRRDDGSFSAFGQSDSEGSLWLTAFVLKSFAQADGLIYVDETVLHDAQDWIRRHQHGDGSFERVGFVHHQELLGGLAGKTALTAYVAISLLEAGDFDGADRALTFLEGRLDEINDPYTTSIVVYALALGARPSAAGVHERLLELAVSGEDLHWGGPAAVEATGYATLALLELGDSLNASRAARWLVGQRNPFGGYGSTQDTVVGLQALIEFATSAKFDVGMTVELVVGDWRYEVTIDEANADVVQIVELPAGADLRIDATGAGRVVAQVVHRSNMPEVQRLPVDMFQIEVDYSTDHVAVDDIIDITASLMFNPPENQAADAGMIVLDVAVPTGFAPVDETLRTLVQEVPQVKRREVAGRKVVLYIEDLGPGESLVLPFKARAQYPVRAQPVTSQVYSYYNPDWRAETLGSRVTVTGN